MGCLEETGKAKGKPGKELVLCVPEDPKSFLPQGSDQSDGMLDLDQAVVVTTNGSERWNGSATRTIALLAKTLEERGDPRAVFSAEVAVTF